LPKLVRQLAQAAQKLAYIAVCKSLDPKKWELCCSVA